MLAPAHPLISIANAPAALSGGRCLSLQVPEAALFQHCLAARKAGVAEDVKSLFLYYSVFCCLLFPIL